MCPGRFDGDNLSWYESNKKKQAKGGDSHLSNIYNIDVDILVSLSVSVIILHAISSWTICHSGD